jgi:hypothetical protein
MKKKLIAVCFLCVLFFVGATETENYRLRFIPTEKPLVIDGHIDDWNLSGGVFVCNDVENLRDRFSVWIYGMYDSEYVYILARWRDETPLNNYEKKGAHGFNGDCLQVRFILFPDSENDKCATYWDLWKDNSETYVMSRESPGKAGQFHWNELPKLLDSQNEGVEMEFFVSEDGSGYDQEVRIPWKLLSAAGKAPKPGESFRFTVEPNFTAGQFGRITTKGIFNEKAEKIDRIFTYCTYSSWGEGILLEKKDVKGLKPDPVRLSDGRTFSVEMKEGVPFADFSDLVQRFTLTGYENIEFDMPYDGYISLNILNSKGDIVRHLLNWERYSKGTHTVEWDGLTDFSYRFPGHPVSSGDYSWEAIIHKGARLTYRGQAGYGGRVPWIGDANDHWLGDHGVPSDIEANSRRLFLSSSGAEGGRHLISTDLEGNTIWGLQNTTGGYDPWDIAADENNVYVLHSSRPAGKDKRAKIIISRVDAWKGSYKKWDGQPDHILSLEEMYGEKDIQDMPDYFKSIDVANGKIYLTASDDGQKQGIYILDSATGKFERYIACEEPVSIDVAGSRAYVISGGEKLVEVDLKSGKEKQILDKLDKAVSVMISGEHAYVSENGSQMCVNVYNLNNKKLLKRYGTKGGRPKIGKWRADSMYNPRGMIISPDGARLWVAEAYNHPKRVSVWNLEDGELVKDFFGTAHYGAGGGAISPRDPNVMIGEACEWLLDEKSGKAECVGVFDNTFHGYANFYQPSNGRLYLAATLGWFGQAMRIFERTAPGEYRLIVEITSNRKDHSKDSPETVVWCDLNLDGKRSDNEIQIYKGHLSIWGSNSWSLNMGNDLTLYPYDITNKQLMIWKTDKMLNNGVPFYDINNMKPVSEEISKRYVAGMSSVFPNIDSSKLLLNLENKELKDPFDYEWACVDTKTWKILWTYPNPFFQVHRSHKAPTYEPGLLRGAFNPIGTFRFPGIIGDAWIINANFGEWYLLSASGFYVSRIFNGNMFEWRWPSEAAPGVDLTNLPSGSGGEDFGGSAIQGNDGKAYIQAGKFGNWNVLLSGLDDAEKLSGKGIKISEADTKESFAIREKILQDYAPKRETVVKKKTINVSDKSGGDFGGVKHIRFSKQSAAEVIIWLAYDAENLYCKWNVADSTPWVNGGKDFSQLYSTGDTVDIQIATDSKANPNRNDPAKGDIRISIANFNGKNIAVIYKFKNDIKKPRTFSSGVLQGYVVDYVDIITDAQIYTKTGNNKYEVIAAIPWKDIGIQPKSGMKFLADFGATHGDPSGTRTRLRTFWANQQTGLVDDIVFELKLEPKNWGTIVLE